MVEPNLSGTLTRFGISISGIVFIRSFMIKRVLFYMKPWKISELMIYRVLLKGNMYTFMCREGDDVLCYAFLYVWYETISSVVDILTVKKINWS